MRVEISGRDSVEARTRSRLGWLARASWRFAILLVMIGFVTQYGARPARAQATAASKARPSMKDPHVLPLTLKPWGFEPAQVTLPNRAVFIQIHNRSGKRNVTFVLTRQPKGVGAAAVPAATVHSVALPPNQINWREYFELAPGDYVLTESGQPGVRCAITIQP